MDADGFIHRHPLLFHVGEPAGWPSIVSHGLLSTTAILDLFGIEGKKRLQFEAWPRDESVSLTKPGLRVVLRDQRPLLPLRDWHLDDGLTVADWCRVLNRRVYLFTTEEGALRLLRRYLGQRLYAIRSADLLARHGGNVEVSHINAGYAMRRPARRGRSTFVSLEAYPNRPIKDFTVLGSIPDFAELVARADMP